MSLIYHSEIWVKGEIRQGRIMMVIGILMLAAAILLFRNELAILRGMSIPVVVALLIPLGYGAYQVIGRPGGLKKVKELTATEPEKALQMEYAKAKIDDRTYRILKLIWPVLILASVILHFLLLTDYYKGVALGLIVLFSTGLLLDSTLHRRLKNYLKELEQLWNMNHQ